MSVLITKSDGTIEAFDASKLTHSLIQAGADEDTAEHIRQEIEKELRPSMSTNEIYSHAFTHLHQDKKESAARYSLKRAVLDFGPSGFPFEAFIAELFRVEGYDATIDQIVKGGCVEHEVDVVAKKGDEKIFVEAKFHNSLAYKTDLKVVLYVKSRIDDIVAAGNPTATGLVVTNTKFTDMAINYASCQQLALLSWDYPHGSTLHERIEKAGLYPITALTSLSKREKTALLNDKIVLCNSLVAKGPQLSHIGVTGNKAEIVLQEARALCSPKRDI